MPAIHLLSRLFGCAEQTGAYVCLLRNLLHQFIVDVGQIKLWGRFVYFVINGFILLLLSSVTDRTMPVAVVN